MLTYSYENRWRWFILFGVSFASTFCSWFFIHAHSFTQFPLFIAHALLLPLALCWMIQGILLCQPNATLLIATIALLHPYYLSEQQLSSTGLLGLVTFLLFLGLALHTFNFSWAVLPSHIIESMLLYAPEMGFLCSQYDILIDEIGYNSWYAAYRLPWLILIGICWGVLLIISWWSLLFGIVLTLFYTFLSSTNKKALIKILALYFPALAVLLLYSFYTKTTLCFTPTFTLPIINHFPQRFFNLFFPTFLNWKQATGPWSSHMVLFRSIALDFLCLIGFLGTCFMLCRKNYALSQASKVLPFYLITLVAFLYDPQTPLFWMNHALFITLGLLFWHEKARKRWPDFFSE